MTSSMVNISFLYPEAEDLIFINGVAILWPDAITYSISGLLPLRNSEEETSVLMNFYAVLRTSMRLILKGSKTYGPAYLK